MEKKKLKLSVTTTSKKTYSSIEKAKSQSKNSVLIEKKYGRPGRKSFASNIKKPSNNFSKSNLLEKSYPKKKQEGLRSDYEKRILAEQRATKRVKGELSEKNLKVKSNTKKKELKLTLSRALSEDDIGIRSRSLASLRRAKLKENRELNQKEIREKLKPVKRQINIPKTITIRELANRMAEQSSNIIKHLLSIGLTVTINHTIDEDTAEYLVKEFGHVPIK